MTADNPALVAGIVASLGAGLATGVGALPILGIGRPSARQENLLLGFASGVMLVASFFSLIAPGIEAAERQGTGAIAASIIVVASVLLGAAALHGLGRSLPELEQYAPSMKLGQPRVRSVCLLVAAITLHNIPEGAAVGIGFAGGDFSAGLSTAIGIGLQNMPEGLAVAGALMTVGFGRLKSFSGGVATGLVEPIAGAISASMLAVASFLLPWASGAAAGAMLYIVLGQILPDARLRQNGEWLLPGLFSGLAIMLVLDAALG